MVWEAFAFRNSQEINGAAAGIFQPTATTCYMEEHKERTPHRGDRCMSCCYVDGVAAMRCARLFFARGPS